jgi:2-polyprenyl-3-methyl-5-hydroxy-6-metoxy-1,4-benzoquinol methylase
MEEVQMSAKPLHPTAAGVHCDLCGHNQFTLLHEWPVGNFWNPATIPIAVWQCKSCELVLLHPVPTAAELPDNGDWWSAKRLGFARRSWFKYRWAKLRHSLVGTPRQRLIRATRKAMPGGRLLDVGCGRGELLLEAKPYYDCVGLEPSARAVAEARASGLTVHEGTFESVEFEPHSFDVIILDAVIEHVTSPTAVLEKINSLLKMNGVVVLTTPKFNGPAYRMHGPDWNGFRHGYHTFLYTGKTLGQFMQKTGFDVLESPRRDRMLDDQLNLWGKKVREVAQLPVPSAQRRAA